MSFKYTVTPKLNQILKEKNMTQTELSIITGIGQGTLSRFDKNSQHKDEHLVCITRALNLKCIDELFDIEEVVC